MKRFKYLTLAALVAFAACDEGGDVVTPPPVTGTVSGVVTIEGTGASGVSVALSTGASATTDGSGAYSFTGVAAGAHTVTISGFASDVSFSASVKAVTIASSGQVATANFDGSYIRTSAILGAVSGGGTALSGVTVAISGQSSASTTTDAAGQYSFSGLRAGSYTVTMSGHDATMYSFASTSSSISVGAGASQVVNFSGTLVTTAKVSGSLFIDEFSKDNTFQSSLEAKLAVANVSISLEGGAVANTITTMTDANGDYSFSNLAAGTYRVTIDATFANVPGMMAFGGTNPQLVTVTAGATGAVNWPFDIATQRIDAAGFLGVDGTNPGVAPISGWTINLYDTQANAAAGGATGRIGTGATGSNGIRTFRFLRSVDVSPNSSAVDNVVFAQIAGAPTAKHAVNGETIIEIKYSAQDSLWAAPDTFDALYSEIVLRTNVAEIDGDVAAGWITEMDVVQSVNSFVKSWTAATTATGRQLWSITAANAVTLGGDGAFPDTVFFKFSTAQAGAGGHGFTATPTAAGGSVSTQTGGTKLLRYIWDGTVPASDTVTVGDWAIAYTDTDIQMRIHHEQDDSTSVPTYTLGDGLTFVSQAQIQLYEVTGAGTVTLAGPTAGTVGTGIVTFPNVAVTKTLFTRARATHSKQFVLNDTIINITLDGSDQVYVDSTLAGGAGASSFATKTKNNTVSGTVLGDDGTGAANVIVTLAPTADNIQGSATKLDTTSAAGAYSFTANVIEGPYTITVADIAGTWQFFDTLKTTSVPLSSGSANNTNATLGTRDVQGEAATFTANFQPDRMDTSIKGVVVNDRDSDYNTLDPDEALSGVTINLIDDADSDGAIDAGEATLATTTTDANGSYSFTGLREDNYIVQAVSPANATVLRALSATGAVTAHIGVKTEPVLGIAGASGNCVLANCINQNLTRNVGNASPPGISDEFPRWNYLTGAAAADGGNLGAGVGPNASNAALTTAPASFVHLFATGTVVGKITAAGVGVAGVRVTITRCQTAAAAPSPPAAGACTAKHGVPSPHIVNFDTDAGGNYTFSGLLEGVYQIDVAPATGGYTTQEGLDGVAASGDEIVLATIQGNNDIETVPAYEIS